MRIQACISYACVIMATGLSQSCDFGQAEGVEVEQTDLRVATSSASQGMDAPGAVDEEEAVGMCLGVVWVDCGGHADVGVANETGSGVGASQESRGDAQEACYRMAELAVASGTAQCKYCVGNTSPCTASLTDDHTVPGDVDFQCTRQGALYICTCTIHFSSLNATLNCADQCPNGDPGQRGSCP